MAYQVPVTAVYEAQREIRPYIYKTPLLRSDSLSDLSGADVWLKCENQQPTGSFKVRGALHKISGLTPPQRKTGIGAASAGNHALGVAHAAASLGPIPTEIFVPATAPATKVEKLHRYPVRIQQIGQTYDETHALASQYFVENGLVEISAFDDLAVITGQGTVGLELIEEMPQVDTIIVPVGGGGLISGINSVFACLNPGCQIVGVQPEASPAALLSFEQDRPLESYDHDLTIADGLAGGFGALPFTLLRAQPPAFLLASEWEIRQAVYTLVHQQQLIIEPSGAIAITPLLHGKLDLTGRTVVCVLTGGNIDTSLLQSILVEFGGDDE